jgi:hypothetical protein
MNRKQVRFIYLTILLTFHAILNSSAQQVFYDDNYDGPNYYDARFSLWLPDSVSEIKGIVLLVPGTQSDGREDIFDEAWQSFAAKRQLGLIGCFFTDRNSNESGGEGYIEAGKGSGEALFSSIEIFGEESKHPELKDAPLYLFGFSAGGQFNYEFVCAYPEKVKAFVVNKGGFYLTLIAPVAAQETPGLFITGQRDVPYRLQTVKGIYSINRWLGANWCYAREYMAKHEIGQSASLSRLFFEEVIKRNNNELSDLDKNYIGFPDEKQIMQKNGAMENSKYFTSWIVSEAFGREWLKFIGKLP